MEIVDFEGGHIDLIDIQNPQSYIGQYITPEYRGWLEAQPESYTVIDRGRVVACAGIYEAWENRGIAWAILSADAGKSMLMLHKAVSAYLNHCGLKRIEATVDIDFKQAHRWMKMLGFKYEGTMKAYTPDGRTQDLYARIR